MKALNDRLNQMRQELKTRKARVMIIGLGSVGNYLLDYLMSLGDQTLEICVVGRNESKLQSDVNIVRVASAIRNQGKSTISIIGNVDLNDVQAIAGAIRQYAPDIIVNSSRAYAGVKYGSISWNNINIIIRK